MNFPLCDLSDSFPDGVLWDLQLDKESFYMLQMFFNQILSGFPHINKKLTYEDTKFLI